MHEYHYRERPVFVVRRYPGTEEYQYEVWGEEFIGESRTVDMHIKTLRQKLGDAAGCIKTVVGIGYRMEAVG